MIWEYHTSVLSSGDIIEFYGFTEDPNTSKYMVVMYYANKDLMKKCWNEDPLKRPSSSKVKKVIENWIFYPSSYEINEELKNNIMEFVNAPIGHNNLATKSHPKACFTSRLLDFTSKKLNEILESENSQASVNEMPVSEDLNDYVIRDSRLLVKASVKANEMQVSEDLNDYIIKGLGSLDIKTDEN
ncbi:unnamed protein product [Rhizophagus irregularis]|nr:unnamed protein product [Rhizophagus irregularis]